MLFQREKNFLHLRREQDAGRLNKHTMRKLLQYIATFLNIKPEMTEWKGIRGEW